MFFRSKLVVELNTINCELLKKFIAYVIENEYYTSTTYKKMILNATNEQEKLKFNNAKEEYLKDYEKRRLIKSD